MEIIVLWLACGLAAAIVMRRKDRSGCLGMIVGMALGPIGLILAVVAAPRFRARRLRGAASDPNPSGEGFAATGMIGPYPYRDEADGRVSVMIQGGVATFPSRKAAEKALSR